MKNYKEKFFILIASVIIGILITTNFNLVGTTRIFQMDSKEYKDASEEKNNLYKEVDRLTEENREIQNKIYSYHQGNDNNSKKIIQDMKTQLLDYSEISGLTTVKGPGIVIKVTDGTYNNIENTNYEINRRILHDNDVALIINELRNAGAEAIAINDYRILGDTGVECDWAFIGFNDKEQVYQPFYFYAIGDPEEMEISVFAEGSYINKLIIRKLNIEIVKKEELILFPTLRTLEPNFMERKD